MNNTQIAPNVKKLFDELKKYEKEGTDSMDWAEYAHYAIDEDSIEKFDLEDWICLKDNYQNRSDNMKSLIAGHIHLNEISSAEIELHILTEMVLNEQIDVAYQALKQITFGFVTTGINYSTNKYFNKSELKGIFLTKESKPLIEKFFTLNFISKALSIAKECGDVQKSEILTFLKIVKQKQRE